MNEIIYKIAKEYFYRTEVVKDILLDGLMLKSKEDLLKFRARMPAGTFYTNHMKNEFCFHGRGLRFKRSNYNTPQDKQPLEEFEIDMELGNGDYLCGIACWMLYRYIEQHYYELTIDFNEAKIKEELEKGVQQNKLYKKYDLYYFV